MLFNVFFYAGSLISSTLTTHKSFKMVDNIQICRVTEADYDDVISIRDDIYDGLDYLPCLFKEWLPTHEGYLARIDGLPVAFRFLVFLDDGKSFCFRSGRVRKEYEGKGVFRKLSEYVMKTVNTRPGVLKQLSGFPERGPVNKIQTGEYTLIVHRDLLVYRLTREKALESIGIARDNHSGQSAVRLLNKDDIVASFEQRSTLYPEDRIVLDWVPCRLLKSNIDLFWRDRFLAVGTIGNDGNYMFVSIGIWATCKIGVRYQLDLCGNIDASLMQHLRIHVNRFIDLKEEAIIFKIFHRPSDDKSLIGKVMEDFGCHIFKQCDNVMYCVENDLK